VRVKGLCGSGAYLRVYRHPAGFCLSRGCGDMTAPEVARLAIL
jgi:hypothetical protein